MPREVIKEEIQKDGNIKVSVVFLATPKDKSPVSDKGFYKGYAQGFMPCESGASINIVYGWSTPKANREQKAPATTAKATADISL